MFTISHPPTDAAVHEFASRWTEQLAQENYIEAYGMLCHVQNHPGRSWVFSPEELRNWIENYGSDTPIPGEPPYKVTKIEQASGEQWGNYLELSPSDARYVGYLGNLDWGLPLNGEWSDLQASFDLVAIDQRVGFVLVALRVP